MTWTHASLARGRNSEYALLPRSQCVVRGSVVIAWLQQRGGRLRVVTPGGLVLGCAGSGPEALMMVVGHAERPRTK